VVGLHQKGIEALVVVQVAVIGVDRALQAAGGEAVEVRVRIVEAVEAADRDGRVEAALGLAELEERGSGWQRAEDADNGGWLCVVS